MGDGLEVAGACRGKCDAGRAANRGVRDLVAELEEEHAGGSLGEEGAVVHAGASGVGGAEGEIAENAFFSGESEGAAGWCFGSSEDDSIGGDVDVWGSVGSVGGCGGWGGVVLEGGGRGGVVVGLEAAVSIEYEGDQVCAVVAGFGGVGIVVEADGGGYGHG